MTLGCRLFSLSCWLRRARKSEGGEPLAAPLAAACAWRGCGAFRQQWGAARKQNSATAARRWPAAAAAAYAPPASTCGAGRAG